MVRGNLWIISKKYIWSGIYIYIYNELRKEVNLASVFFPPVPEVMASTSLLWWERRGTEEPWRWDTTGAGRRERNGASPCSSPVSAAWPSSEDPSRGRGGDRMYGRRGKYPATAPTVTLRSYTSVRKWTHVWCELLTHQHHGTSFL